MPEPPLFFFFLLFLPNTGWPEGTKEKPESKKKIYTVIEFESNFMNRKKEKVM